MTPAIDAAEDAQVPFSLHRYEHDATADSFGLEAAAKLGVLPERVFKTLVARVDGKRLVLALLPVTSRLDLKRLAAVVGGRKAELADPAVAERATGYVVGGISPLGGRKKLPTLVDASAAQQDTIFVSAGQRGIQMELSPTDLVRVTSATVADLVAR
jgi:Cys-tRNA(Pro)/Cys-tRNA(Cys) deacylase